MSRLPVPYPDPLTDQWDAQGLLRNLQWLAAQIDASAAPTGAIIMVRTGTVCPSGWTKVSTNNGAYLRISTGAGGGTGGDLVVAITDPGHTHAVGTIAAGSHTHAVGTIAAGSHLHAAGTLSGDSVANHDHGSPTSGPSATLAVASGGGAAPAGGLHTHTISLDGAHGHTVSGSTGSTTPSMAGTSAATTPSMAGSSASGTTGISGTIAPTFLDVLLCEKD